MWLPSVFMQTVSAQEAKYTHETNQLWIAPYLQNVSQTSIIIMWETCLETKGSIEFGIDSLKMTQRVEEKKASKIHELKLPDLLPGTSYFYKCKWNKGQTEIHTFKTAPPSGYKNVKIVAYGDTRSYPPDHARVAKQIAIAKPDLILHSGDFVMYGADQESWKPQFFDPVRPFCSEIPVLTVLGNHERNSQYYYNFYALNNNEAWWSTDYGPVHIIGLDSNQPGLPGSDQYKWLVNDLERNKDAKWIIVMFHHPLFGCRPERYVNDLRWEWHPIFQKYNVDLVISGDDHYYSRSFPIGKAEKDPHGVTYIISAGGGAPLYPTESKEYTAYRRTIHHFVELEFNDKQLIGRAIDVDGNIFDSFIRNKNAYVGTDEIYAYDMLVLEEELKRSFKMSALKRNQDGFTFDFNFSVPISIAIPLNAKFMSYSDNWSIDEVGISDRIAPDQKLKVRFKASYDGHVPEDFPHLEFIISAVDTAMWKQPYSPAGFKNTNISFNLEEALYLSLLNKKDQLNTSNDALSFIEYFPDSKYSSTIINQFWKTVKTKESQLALSEQVRKIFQGNKDPRYNPIEFLLNDFSHWDDWMNSLEKLSVTERTVFKDNLLALPALGRSGGGMICNWHIAGVFDNPEDAGFFTKYSPEEEVSLHDSYNNSFGESISWEKVFLSEGEEMNFANLYDRNMEGVVYAYCEIQSEKKCKVPMLMGSDDGIVIWINGKEIYRHNEARACVRGEDIVTVNLKKGKNTLLVKVNQFGGGWGMFVDIIDKDHLLILPNE
jgi:hypothetical protein